MSVKLNGLEQSATNTTLLGVVAGAARYFGLNVDEVDLFGLTGHAFVINIHEEICPSSPYIWNIEPFFANARNVGPDCEMLGCYSRQSPYDERAKLEARLRATLDAGNPCSLEHLEHQLITGYDDEGFDTARPWPNEVVRPRLTSGTWDELDPNVPVLFFTWSKCDPATREAAIDAALRYAIDLWDNPRLHECDHYGIGPNAYANWLAAIDAGHGGSHGNWWSATVWAECRRMAGAFVERVGKDRAGGDAWSALSAEYRTIADLLARAAPKDLPALEKRAVVAEAFDRDRAAVEALRSLV